MSMQLSNVGAVSLCLTLFICLLTLCCANADHQSKRQHEGGSTRRHSGVRGNDNVLSIKIAEDPRCATRIKNLCQFHGDIIYNNMDVMKCLQRYQVRTSDVHDSQPYPYR